MKKIIGCLIFISFIVNAEDMFSLSKSYFISCSGKSLYTRDVKNRALDTVKFDDKINDISVNYNYNLISLTFKESSSIVYNIPEKCMVNAKVIWSESGSFTIIQYVEEVYIVKTSNLFKYFQNTKKKYIEQRIVAPEFSTIRASKCYGDSVLFLRNYYGERVSCSLYFIQTKNNVYLGQYSLVKSKSEKKHLKSMLINGNFTETGKGEVKNGVYTFYIDVH